MVWDKFEDNMAENWIRIIIWTIAVLSFFGLGFFLFPWLFESLAFSTKWFLSMILAFIAFSLIGMGGNYIFTVTLIKFLGQHSKYDTQFEEADKKMDEVMGKRD